ncbi:hypothetical protein [Nocardioides sp.]|uniref:hypothetical protein n=1 Tax=Nocardioides sp. TaxID=35761 RepID=UPI00286CC18C|nr:hypothetical protein [Nocardioides sp.]
MRTLLGALLALLLVGGCTASSDAPTASRTTPRPSPTAATAAATATPAAASEPLAWPDIGVGDRMRPTPRVYDYLCIDPPTELVDTAPVRQQSRTVATGDATLLERHLVYPDVATAAEALEDLRAELALCGRSRAHDGARMAWTRLSWSDEAELRLERRVPTGADTEAWHLYDTRVPAAPLGAFVTLLRVDETVLVTDRRSGLDPTTPEGLATASRAGELRLLDAVASLSVVAGRQDG